MSLLFLQAYNRFWFRLLRPWNGLGHLDHDITNGLFGWRWNKNDGKKKVEKSGGKIFLLGI